MSPPPMDPTFVRFNIGHFTGTSDHKDFPSYGVRSSWTEHYLVFPVSLHRPATGKEQAQLICPVCKATLSLTVASPGAARKAQYLKTLAGLGLMMVGAALFILGWTRYGGWPGVLNDAPLLCCGSGLAFAFGLYLGGDASDEFQNTVWFSQPSTGHTLNRQK